MKAPWNVTLAESDTWSTTKFVIYFLEVALLGAALVIGSVFLVLWAVGVALP